MSPPTDLPNNSSTYTNKLIALQASFPGLLTQYQNDFVTYNKNPVDSNPIQSIFYSDRTNIQTAFDSLFQVIGNLQSDLTKIDASTNILNASIKTDKQSYKQLTHKLDMYNGKIDTASAMKDDYSKLYFDTFVSNVSLFVGICLAITVMFRVFGKQNIATAVTNAGANASNAINAITNTVTKPKGP
jgi:hypothetical protein